MIAQFNSLCKRILTFTRVCANIMQLAFLPSFYEHRGKRDEKAYSKKKQSAFMHFASWHSFQIYLFFSSHSSPLFAFSFALISFLSLSLLTQYKWTIVMHNCFYAANGPLLPAVSFEFVFLQCKKWLANERSDTVLPSLFSSHAHPNKSTQTHIETYIMKEWGIVPQEILMQIK